MPRIRALALSATLLFLLPGPTSIGAQRWCCEGDKWLKWSEDRREAYVVGYIEGYYNGRSSGCRSGWERIQPERYYDEDLQCDKDGLDFPKGYEHAHDITTFYQRYPENRILYPAEILEALGDGETLEQLHDHPPFGAVKPDSRKRKK
jgi:hypothetical protein